MKKLLTGIILSGITIYVLVSKVDISEFARLKNADFRYLFALFLFSTAGQIAFAGRWFYLLAGRVSYKTCLWSYLMGAGGNMVLPARGGDIFRMFFVKNNSRASYTFVLSRLFLEKIIDFVFTVFLGISAFFLMGIKKMPGENKVIFIISFIVISGILTALLILRYRTIKLIDFLKKIASWLKMKNEFHYKIESNLLDLAAFLSLKSFLKPSLVTVSLWMGFYSGAYLSVSLMLNMDLSWLEIIFLMFCGAMGVAVPSAPSGIGIFHASIVSGFLLMGKSAEAGLVYATILHLSQFLVFTSISLLFYLLWTFQKSDARKITHGSD